MREFHAKQGTPEWLKARVGRITASRIGDVIAKRKRGSDELACRRDYRMELLCERLTGRAADHYVSPEMDWGSDNEKYAAAAYEVAMEVTADEVGLVLHPLMDFAGASPDRLINHDGMLEIKCPKTATHLDWLMAGIIPAEHEPQMMWGMACAERQWADFMSFDPRLPEGLRIFTARLERDEKRIAEMEYAVMEFHAEIEALMKRLGAPEWKPVMPGFRSEGTVRIGAVDVPEDLMNYLGSEGLEMVP